MQSVIAVHCDDRLRGSLRDRIVKDPALEKYRLVVQLQHKPGRNPGWAKLRSAGGDRGAINLEWDGSARTLTARIVSKSRRPAGAIIGAFLAYLLERHGRSLRSVVVLP